MYKILPLLILSAVLTGCLEDECNETLTYTAWHPVVISAQEWRTDEFSLTSPDQVCDPSGFYVYGDILFVLDRSKGLHIIDNADNANPRPLHFLHIPGGEGISVRNDMLYVNQYVDLLAFDISDPTEPVFLSRTENVFDAQSNFATGVMGNGDVTVDWIEGTETFQSDCNDPFSGQGWRWRDQTLFISSSMDFAAAVNSFSNTAGTPSGGEQLGVGGSLARFTINKGTLYAVDNSSLRVFSLSDPKQPEFIGINRMNWGIETIFPYRDQLYIGANDGMYIYGIEDPLAPELFATVQHVRSCDPVVVQNDMAYVTMWGGSDCGNVQDQLMVVDVKNPRSPKTLQMLPMSNSHGLGVDGDKLFLCSGPEGLKVLELLSDGTVGAELHATRDFPAKDVIVLPGQRELIVLGWETAGIKQFDYDGSGLPTAVGEIAICD
ncbi:hypothetical protein CLV84_3012 [Neolewinella xylanilytica]|uniref:LVIVD repeat-containing protein n=1 Tax=Neolewinella xylanilytica TaxID=1514080 RepID=A0A2S6I4I5_9BACT|nr:hypothetical protein [Neolewinella xylanilytica]PPK86095.1 hypothetical protein CLV84_3012 [Neolewinella xylanilytica]